MSGISAVKYIAEIGSNHNQDIKRIRELINQAIKLGCWAVKFQYYKAQQLYAPGCCPEGLSKTELSFDMVKEISEICRESGLAFGCSVFHENDIFDIAPYVDYIKIASYELTKKNLIKTIAQEAPTVPVHISTGLASLDEIESAILQIHHHNPEIVLYHCCAEYPAPANHIDLKKITMYQNYFPKYIKSGYSDHSRDHIVVCGAVALGAEYIEFHYDLENHEGLESKYGHCYDFFSAKIMIENAERMKAATLPYIIPRIEKLRRADPEDGMRPCKEIRI